MGTIVCVYDGQRTTLGVEPCLPLFESGSVAHCYTPCWLTLTFLGVYCSPLIFSKDGMTDAYYHS